MFEAIILGIVQGIAEFLPISSTAHLVLFPWAFGWENALLSSLSFDVALHAGTLVSILICFWRDIVTMLRTDRYLIAYIVLATIPAGLAGVLLEDYVSGALRGPAIIAASLVVFGLVMLAADRKGRGLKDLRAMSLRDAMIIGAAQAVALIPGVSRSGITIAAALFCGLRRDEAARFSFLLSLPVIGGASVLEGRKLLSAGIESDAALIAAGFLAALITGVAAIKFMLGYLKKHRLDAFVIYRMLLAVVIIGLIWNGQ